ncbi:MAG: lysozyme inhibitor LprI family protein [Caulobacteraceae bacterium]
MRLRNVVIAACGLAAIGLGPGRAAAQAPVPGASPQLEDCLNHVIDNEHGSRWPAVLICYEDEFSAQNRRLQAAYLTLETAAKRLGPRALDEMASSRRQWEAYRDAWCAFEQERFIKPNADVARMSCRVEVTKTQLGRVTEQIVVLR